MSDDRKDYIGGGDIASIIGEGYKTPLQVWEEKVNGEPELSPELARKFKMRKKLEPLVIEALGDLYGIFATKVSFPEPNRYTDPLATYRRAEIDFECPMTSRLASDFPELERMPLGETINGEIKTSLYETAEWKEEMPTGTAAQSMWGLGVTGRLACLVVPAFGIIDRVEIKPVLRSDAAIAYLRTVAAAFWQNVQSRRPPAPSNLDDMKRAVLRLRGEPVELSDEAYTTLVAVLDKRAIINAEKKALDSLEYELFDFVRQAWNVPVDPDAELPHEKAVLLYKGRQVSTFNRIVRKEYTVPTSSYRQLRKVNGK